MGASDASGVSDTYFEQVEHWSQDVSPFTVKLLRKALAVLPAGISSLLDIGCGTGEFCRMAAAEGLATIGLDLSQAALQQGRGFLRLRAALPSLPFPDGAFDLVTAFDVIEHLPEDYYRMSLAEMFRVSRSWVLLVVPHAEDLSFFRHHCVVCGHQFHENLHLRSLSFQGLSRDVQEAGGVAELLFFGEENWGYFDFLSAHAPSEVAGRWPQWERAICPRCGSSERGPVPAGSESLWKGLELGLHEEFQRHPAYWQRNRATEMGILFHKSGYACEATTRYGYRLGMTRTEPAVSGARVREPMGSTSPEQSGTPGATRGPALLTVGQRRVCLYPENSDPATLQHPVNLTAWPRSLIACASELQSLPRPINYAAFSYLYLEGQQWGEVVRIGERWARLFRPDLPGGHACFVLSGRALWEGTLEVEVFDQCPGSFVIEMYDEGSCRYVPVGTVNMTGSEEWQLCSFRIPSVLPGRWGYLCHLLAGALSECVPIARLGVGRAETVASRRLSANQDLSWGLTDTEYPSGLFHGEQLVALLSEHDFFLNAVTLDGQGSVPIILHQALEWRCGTPLLLALGVFDALPVVLPDERKGMAERALFLALKSTMDRNGVRRSPSDLQT